MHVLALYFFDTTSTTVYEHKVRAQKAFRPSAAASRGATNCGSSDGWQCATSVYAAASARPRTTSPITPMPSTTINRPSNACWVRVPKPDEASIRNRP